MARICPQPPAPLSRRQHRTPQDRGVVQDLSPIHALPPPTPPPPPLPRVSGASAASIEQPEAEW